jgi:transcription initiation factor IIE alpha subunit
MLENKPTLTDDQIREALKLLTQQFLGLGLDLAVLAKALLKKGLLTEDEITEAKKQVKQEGDEQLAKIGRATRQGPAGGVQ